MKEFMMFYHTSLRNIGLFTSLTLALLIRTESLYTILSLFTSVIALSVNYHLIQEYNTYRKTHPYENIKKWMDLIKLTIILNIGILGIILHRLSKKL